MTKDTGRNHDKFDVVVWRMRAFLGAIVFCLILADTPVLSETGRKGTTIKRVRNTRVARNTGVTRVVTET